MGVDLQYDDRDVGYLLGVWLVLLALLAVSTVRSDYSPVVSSVGDPGIFVGLLGLVIVGATTAEYQDIALGVPMSVCGGLVVWSVVQTVVTDSLPLADGTILLAVGLVLLGGLFVREGTVIAQGRRHRGGQTPPQTRWKWWVGVGVLLAAGTVGFL
jgi:hypothetical protein